MVNKRYSDSNRMKCLILIIFASHAHNQIIIILPCPKCVIFRKSDILSKRPLLRADEVLGSSHQAKVVSLLLKLIFHL